MQRAVVIGAGAMGRRHIKAIGVSEAFTFCGVSDLRQEALLLAQQEGATPEQCFADTTAMLDAVKPDCVIVATTATSHHALASLAIARGVKKLVVEKPFTVSIAQARELNALCAANGVRLAVNHGMRYDTHYGMIRDVTLSEGLGPVTSLFFSGGNMGVAMNASHQFEFFRFLTGCHPHLVTAWFDPTPVANPRGAQFADVAGQIRTENANGQRQYIEIGPDQGHGLQMVIHCRYGHVHADLLQGRVTVNRRKPEHRDLPTSRYGMPFDIEEHAIPKPDALATAAKVLDALDKGEGFPDGVVGERVIRTLVAAYVSHESGQARVDINGNLPEERTFPWA